MQISKRLVLKGVVYSVAVASLSFAATEVYAASPAMTCPNNGLTFLGECVTPEDCQEQCVIADGPDAVGSCQTVHGSPNCCVCQF